MNPNEREMHYYVESYRDPLDCDTPRFYDECELADHLAKGKPWEWVEDEEEELKASIIIHNEEKPHGVIADPCDAYVLKTCDGQYYSIDYYNERRSAWGLYAV